LPRPIEQWGLPDRSSPLALADPSELPRPPAWVGCALFGVGCGLPIALCAGYFALVLMSLTAVMCGGRIEAEALSPDGSRLARLREYNCGAVDTFHTYVEVTDRPTAPPTDKPDFERSVLVQRISPNLVSVEWQDDTTLVVEHVPGYRVDRQLGAWRGIRIVYQDRAMRAAVGTDEAGEEAGGDAESEMRE
jgi:hypothetical protein